MLSSNDIRQQFIDYFFERGHTFVPSAPLPVRDDPTLLFQNSGMVQFKDVFLGTGTRPYKRATNSQKCLRVSGKHNDLEDVGRDTYHHTFFEMLGYWSFGDYFKRDAIPWIWELYTDVWGLPRERLYATVFAGDPEDGIERDDEAADLWRETTDIDPDHIQFWGKKDNFWEMADTGPCGPSSEIHIDLTPDGSGGPLVNADDPRVIELGNIVFIQYNRDSSGVVTALPAKHVDFGGGLERTVAAMQGKSSTYDTDLFTTIFDSISEIAGVEPYGSSHHADIAYRVVADHLRALTFSIADGALPSNEGAGYVLRRILRRAVRHGRQTMDIREPFLHRLVPTVVELMGGAFPELRKHSGHVVEVIRDEEESFARTLDRGIELFEAAAKLVEASGDTQIPAEDAFRLHDTYGFPLDLTQVMAEERGLGVDVAGFERLMADARDLSRAAAGKGDVMASLLEIVQRESPPSTEFLGYDETHSHVETSMLVSRLAEGQAYQVCQRADTNEPVAIALGRTPFYAEAGGQVGDTGVIETPSGRVRVSDTQKVGGVHFHLGFVEEGTVETSTAQKLVLQVDEPRRQKILGNHTGTHMMNLGLRKVLGMHVEQKGSLVDADRLRFDLSHPHPVTPDEIGLIEEHVRRDIERDLPVHDGVVPLDEAYKIRNLRAVFGEKYPDMIRVVSIGVPVERLTAEPDNPEWDHYSIELCGGTHLGKTSEAATFTIVHEEAVAKGIRRVLALTGTAAQEAVQRGQDLLRRVESLGDATPDDLASGVAELTETLSSAAVPAVVRAELRDRLSDLQRKAKDQEKERGKALQDEVAVQIDALAATSPNDVVVGEVDGAEAGVLRAAVEQARGRHGGKAILVASAVDGKVSIVAAVPKFVVERGLKAGDWVREAAASAGGRGGGRPDIAQAGAKDPSKLTAALDAARAHASRVLGS